MNFNSACRKPSSLFKSFDHLLGALIPLST
jgi:hypothetical protein